MVMMTQRSLAVAYLSSNFWGRFQIDDLEEILVVIGKIDTVKNGIVDERLNEHSLDFIHTELRITEVSYTAQDTRTAGRTGINLMDMITDVFSGHG